jgi:predicted NAD/FAD-binding protein
MGPQWFIRPNDFNQRNVHRDRQTQRFLPADGRGRAFDHLIIANQFHQATGVIRAMP